MTVEELEVLEPGTLIWNTMPAGDYPSPIIFLEWYTMDDCYGVEHWSLRHIRIFRPGRGIQELPVFLNLDRIRDQLHREPPC
jgi:hypothetical protein